MVRSVERLNGHVVDDVLAVMAAGCQYGGGSVY